jgi:hypothetical protein
MTQKISPTSDPIYFLGQTVEQTHFRTKSETNLRSVWTPQTRSDTLCVLPPRDAAPLVSNYPPTLTRIDLVELAIDTGQPATGPPLPLADDHRCLAQASACHRLG